MGAYERLWRSVIKQALTDLKRPDFRVEYEEAKAWLLKPNADFANVCELADVEAERVRMTARKILRSKKKGRRILSPKLSCISRLFNVEQ